MRNMSKTSPRVLPFCPCRCPFSDSKSDELTGLVLTLACSICVKSVLPSSIVAMQEDEERKREETERRRNGMGSVWAELQQRGLDK